MSELGDRWQGGSWVGRTVEALTEAEVAVLPEWFAVERRAGHLGPGCGSAEFEGGDWRYQIEWRMVLGHRSGLVFAFREWLSARRSVS